MNRKINTFTMIGLLLLSAALCLTLYNLSDDMRAEEAAEAVMEELREAISYSTEQGLSNGILAVESKDFPDYVLNPEMEMPAQTIDGTDYIGILEIPVLNVVLPVLSDWSYPKLRMAPCRYTGSAYLNNMVIAAHNYESHFGRIKNLSQGDEVQFTDIDGNLFKYEVMEVEILSPDSTAEMTGGGWDLTLFTCTIGGQSRVTVRCALQ